MYMSHYMIHNIMKYVINDYYKEDYDRYTAEDYYDNYCFQYTFSEWYFFKLSLIFFFVSSL